MAKNQSVKAQEMKNINTRLMDLVAVKNLNPTIFTLRIDKDKTIIFKGQETKTLLIKDIISIAGSTKAFSGINGMGKSAPLYIDDKDVRIHLGYETEDGKGQDILDEKRTLEILKTNFKEFKKIAKEVFNDIPKKALLEKVILENNDIEAKKIKFVEEELDLVIKYPEED